jgi:YfiH family protein
MKTPMKTPTEMLPEVLPEDRALALARVLDGWPALPRVGALSTSRQGGVSEGAWGLAGGGAGGLNLGLHVGDVRERVLANRARLLSLTGVPILWLDQVHGTAVIDADSFINEEAGPAPPCADAAVCTRPGLALSVMTADCLPVLLTDAEGRCIGAAHAGWRGLCAGVIEATIQAMRHRLAPHAPIRAWLGPAIGPRAFEVGEEVRQAFLDQDRQAASGFTSGRASGKWLADLAVLARQRLRACGIDDVQGGKHCTFEAPERFYSHRRDRVSGRMASLIWIRP